MGSRCDGSGTPALRKNGKGENTGETYEKFPPLMFLNQS